VPRLAFISFILISASDARVSASTALSIAALSSSSCNRTMPQHSIPDTQVPQQSKLSQQLVHGVQMQGLLAFTTEKLHTKTGNTV
jgi:hypothetical protein